MKLLGKKLFIYLFLFFINPKIKIKFVDIPTEYDNYEETIYFNLNDLTDIGVLRHIKEVHNFPNNYHILTIGLFHEIGHYYTLNINNVDWETRALLSLKPIHRIKQSKRLQDKYFNLKEEWDATEWAIEYIKKHPIRCKLLDKILRNI